MIRHRIALALAAITLSMFLAEAANALPLSTKSGTSTVTGLWKPLDWTTSVIEDPETGLKTFDVTGIPEFLLDYEASGTFSGSGYSASGAITVRYTFGTGEFCVITEWDNGSKTLSVRATDLLSPIGKVSVESFNIDKSTYDSLEAKGDNPVVGDTFFLFATSLIDPVLSITVDDPIDPTKFTAAFPQPFEHLGPFAYSTKKEDKKFFKTLLPLLLSTLEDDECVEDENECRFKWKGWVLDTDRLNADCGNEEDGFSPCGGARFSSINVPEPGTLALFGLGLAGLAARRRSRQYQ